MIIPITWFQYWKVVGIIAVMYYAVVLALFFRNDIKKLLTSKRIKKKADPIETATEA